jgi:NTP pyrophosphatase (non-canonical NTP hydrolase)
MWDQISDLHACHREVPVEIQLLKLTEETGEAAEAFIGIHGLNSRKGVCRSRDDLLAEPADVIITAAVATGVTGGDLEEARSHLEQRLTVVTERARRRRRGKPAGRHGRKAIRTPDPLDAKGILRLRLPLVI